jgi:hypothetical protein
MIGRAGKVAKLSFKAHPQSGMPGYALAIAGQRAPQDWLGHRSIQHTVRYTELSPT